jgi:ADP-ribose pyrophosphatase YjhB (NUDIX family)
VWALPGGVVEDDELLTEALEEEAADVLSYKNLN